MKKILITGGSGFIGRNITESFLKNKYTLFTPARAELDCSNDDSVREYFARHQFDVVIHAAAKPSHRNAPDRNNLLLTNSRMIANLLHYRHRWGKLLNMGSGAIYDMRHYIPKMKESYFGTYIPADEHGYNKYLLGKLLPCIENVYDFRLFGVFGKYEDYAIRFISNAICKAISGMPITLQQNRKFDYLFIDDLMPVLEHFIERSPQEKSFNITPDHTLELLHVAEMVRTVAGNGIDICVATEGMGTEYSGDNSLLHKEVPSLQFTPAETAIGMLYEWYSSNRYNINKELLLKDK
jgi:GDP-L-fucose synthase